MKRFRLIVAITVSILILIVILQNTQRVDTKLLFTTITMPRALLLLITFAAGCITGLIAALQLHSRKVHKTDKSK